MVYLSKLVQDFYKPGDVAKMLGVTPMTIINYDKQGLINFDRTSTNKRLVSKQNLIEYLTKADLLVDDMSKTKSDVIYCRVSTHKQQQTGDLDRQVNTILAYIALQNPQNVTILKEVGSGLNDNRKQLNKLLQMVMNNEVNRIFINYKDRLTRFGFNYLKAVCDYHNVPIIIVSNETNNKTIQEELAEDLCAIIHSFSGKLYGMRNKQFKELKEDLNNIKVDNTNDIGSET